jgi:anti-sigma factor (TIGR02949 family)
MSREILCADVRARLDPLQDRQIPESDAERIEAHLEGCPECRAIMANRKALRARVRSAVRDAEVPPDLGHRVQFAITRAAAPRHFFSGGYGRTLLAVAAALLITAGGFYFRPASEAPSKETQQQFIARLTDEVAPMMRVGLRQHIHCGVFREYPINAPALASLAAGKQVSAALIDAVEAHAPVGLDVVLAHRCTYQGREYIHVVARGKGHLMSLLITRRAAGETLAPDAKAATRLDPDILSAEAQSGPDAFSIDAFQTGEYFVYLVSDSAPAQNRKALEAMTPQVRAALL